MTDERILDEDILGEDDKKSSPGMAELARRLLMTGVGAIFMTESSIRKGLSEVKVPKEAIAGLMENMRKQKDDLFKIIGGELHKFFSNINIHQEIQKALDGMEMDVDAKISFKKKK